MPGKRRPRLSMRMVVLKPRPNAGKKPKGKKKKQKAKRVVPAPSGRRVTQYQDWTGDKPDARRFRLALTDPFAIGAMGCRVVDSYSLPTATYHIRANLQVTSNATGDCYFALLPSPCLTAVAPGANGGGPIITGLNNFTQNTWTPTTPGAFYLLSPTSLSTVLTEYRVVAWGIRLIAKDTAFNTKGKIYTAMVPTTENAPSWNTLESVTGNAQSIGEYTIGMNLNSINSVVNLPGVRTYSMQDLLRGEVTINPVPTGESFYQFKGTTDRSAVPWNTGQVLADEGVFNNTTGLVNATAGGRKDIASLRGGRAVIFYASGLPQDSNEFDVEVVYHIEGTPNVVQVGPAGALVPSSMRPSVGSTDLVEKIISVASAAYNLYRFSRDPVNAISATRAVQWVD